MANNAINPRLTIFNSFLKDNAAKEFTTMFNEKAGNWLEIKRLALAHSELKNEIAKLDYINDLADLSDDHLPVVKAFVDNARMKNLRDIALNFGKTELLDLVKTTKVPPSVLGDTLVKKQANYVQILGNKLFAQVPTAVIQRMVGTPIETPISDPILRGGITTFLSNQDEAFNIKTTSIYEAFKNENAFKGIAPELQDAVKTTLKTVQRVAAISPVAEAIPVLIKANMHTAFQVSEMPEKQFIQAFKGELGENGEAIAKQLHTNAVNSRIRNEHALMALKEAGQGTGIAFIDKSLNVSESSLTKMAGRGKITLSDRRKKLINKTLDKHNLSWDLLFGDADVCECGECTSVYSAASYFVELMQYLRNNNLDPNATGTVAIEADPKDISGTPLKKLLNRRPDLGCLELTCANTNTILPYVDLVNEVMENYVVFKHPKPFNVADETSSELLAAPQHTEYQAYRILKDRKSVV